eukprot:s153_g19.t1
MDLHEPKDVTPRSPKGFRKRWSSTKRDATDSSDVNSVRSFEPGSAGDIAEDQIDDLFAGHDDLDGFSEVGSWGHIQWKNQDDLYDPESPINTPPQSSGSPVIYDPHGVEPAWLHSALETASKRQKLQTDKLPWEVGSMCQIFRTGDSFQGTILDNYKNVFLPACLGCEDVLNSVVTSEPHVPATAAQFDPPVLTVNLRKVRHELPDEDIRRVAICKLRDIVLQDPLATQLGASIQTHLNLVGTTASADQSIRDCFRMKASSTLQKRAGSLWRLTKLLRGIGVLNPLRLREEQLYQVLCELRDSGAGATAAQHMIEALHFLDATAKFQLVDLREVISGRCRGVAKDMYLTKNPLEQKRPLLLTHVRYLEHLFPSLPANMKCILGQLLFCVHACCRWKDSQRLKSLRVEHGHGDVLIHAEALQSKTATSAEARTWFLPYVALGSGVTGADWGSDWIAARDSENLGFRDFILPSYSERTSEWTANPMCASEATFWLREFLEGSLESGAALSYGSHSCKTTILTWAGRCLKVQFTPTDRRLLGHHLESSMKSILAYSRESYVTLYSKVLQMFRLMRDKQFNPDLPAIDRVVQLSDETVDEHTAEMSNHADEPEIVSDSESSVASECGQAGDEMFQERPMREGLTSLFPDFPGVPESDLMVHKVSGLVHVFNEDGFLSCGRQPSLNFKAYNQMRDRTLVEGCSQCKRVFATRAAQT